MSAEVKILDGNTFVVSDSSGDIEASMTDPTGSVFVRHALPLEVDTHDRRPAAQPAVGSRRPAVTSRRASSWVPGTGTVYIDAKLSVIRQRAVGDGFHEGAPRSSTTTTRPSTSTCVSRPAVISPISSRSKGRPEEEGRLLRARRRRPPGARLQARDLQSRDVGSRRTAPCSVDEKGLSFAVHIEAPRTDGRRDPPPWSPRSGSPGGASSRPSTSAAPRGPGPIWKRSLDRWLEESAAPRLRLGPAEIDL